MLQNHGYRDTLCNGVVLPSAGTSLGDPIEVGALAAALVDRRPAGTLPLLLMAAKSWSGHAEPGAGAMGGHKEEGQQTLEAVASKLWVALLSTARTAKPRVHCGNVEFCLRL